MCFLNYSIFTLINNIKISLKALSRHGIFFILSQGIVDGSASKPALRQDTGYMVEKTYNDIAPYLGAFGAYLMPQ